MTLHLLDDKTAPKSQRFRWQLKAKNGKIVAASSEGFSTARDCAKNVLRAMDGIYDNFEINDDGGTVVSFRGREPVKVRP